MPWVASDAKGHTKKAKSADARKQWAATADAVLKKSADEGHAIRVANAAVKKRGKK